MFHQYNRILLTRMKFIGDVVLTTPLIRTLRENFPKAYIGYLGEKKAVSLLEQNPYLDEIIPFDFEQKGILYQLKMFSLLRSKKFDVVIDLFCNPRTALLSFITGAKVRVGGDVRVRKKFYTTLVKDDGKPKSAIDFHYQSLKAIGVNSHFYNTTQIFLTSEEKKEAKNFLQSLGMEIEKSIVVVHPGATWENKVWLKEHFFSLIQKLVENHKINILLSPGPKDKELIHYLSTSSTHSLYQLPLLSVRKLAAILSQSSVFVSNDCGPMHIGVAVGVKTIGIFGPEPTEVWFPYDKEKGHVALFKKIPCSPCRTTVCNNATHLECMKLITVDEVYNAVCERL